LSDSGVSFEDSIRKLLDDMGFQDVPRWGNNREILTLGGQEIDAFGRFGDLYLVVDARSSVSPRAMRRGIRRQLQIINGYRGAVTRDIRSRYGPHHGCRDTIFIFWTKDKVLEAENLQLARQFGIAIRDYFDLNCYNEFFEISKSSAVLRNGFLMDIALQIDRLDIFQEGPSINVSAVRTKVGARKLYTFFISAKDLLEFAYIFRVETNNLLSSSYQRLLQKKKMSKLRTYLSEHSGFFPNNLIATTHERLRLNHEDDRQKVQSGTLQLPNKPCYLEILDGQHRLYAYAGLPNLQDHYLCVTAVQTEEGAPLSGIEKAALFVTINKEQTPVPAHILWDLYRFIDPESTRAEVSTFVYEINNKPPFKDLIKLPRVRSSQAYLSFANMCISLFKGKLFENYGTQPTFRNAFESYFEVLLSDRNLREDWDRSVTNKQRKGFLCTNNGISILLKLLRMILEKKSLPQERRIGTWKQSLNNWVVQPLNNYLGTKRRRDIPLDPFLDLRRANTSEGERTKTANEIFALSPLAQIQQTRNT